MSSIFHKKPEIRQIAPIAPPAQRVKTDWNKVDLSVTREGTKFILPADPAPMETAEGIAFLQRVQKDEEAEYVLNEAIPGHFYDGVVAFAKALKEIYGFAQATHVTVRTFFGETKSPPKFINVRTSHDPNDVITVPYGSFSIPGVEGTVETQFGESGGIPCLRLIAKIKKKHAHVLQDIVKMTRWFSQNESIYKGKAITLNKAGENGVDFEEQIPYFNPHAGNEVTIFTEEVESLIDTAIMTPIRKTEECVTAGVPLRRGILLEGPYGTGKTLTARMTARACIESDWTFVHVTAAAAFKTGLVFARKYQPAVVFCEDIDHLISNRGDNANDLINEIDGVVGKNDKIMVVFTTNFAKNIDKALLRPGRLDTVISLRPPKADAVARLIRHYSNNLLADGADLEEISKRIEATEAIPATIREMVERSKLAMIRNGNTKITVADLDITAEGMKNHHALIAEASEGKEYIPTLDRALADMVVRSVNKALGRE